MMPLQALLFDVDGTLADTERDGHRVAFNRAFADAGLDWEWSPRRYGELLCVTGGKERIAHYIAHYQPTLPPAAGDSAWIAGLHRAKTKHYTALLAAGAIPLRSGVARLLAEVRQAGLRLAIVTTTTPENVTALLHHTLGAEALSWFEVIAAGDVVAAKKPAADIYHYALAQLQLPAAAALAFEDSANGLQAARGADLTTVVAVNGYTADEAFPDAALVLDQWGEPDHPFEQLGGDAVAAQWLDLALLRQIHQRALRSPA